jgi:hypothetical protein
MGLFKTKTKQMTAQEFIKSTELVVKFDNTNGCILEEELPNLLIEFAKLSRQEISDEEIEKAARDYDNSVIYGPPLLHFEQGAFWYREQISLKADKK